MRLRAGDFGFPGYLEVVCATAAFVPYSCARRWDSGMADDPAVVERGVLTAAAEAWVWLSAGPR